jgi:hypothetical protein
MTGMDEHRIVVWPDNYGDTIGAGCSCGWSGWYPWDRNDATVVVYNRPTNVSRITFSGVPLDVIQAEHDAEIARAE